MGAGASLLTKGFLQPARKHAARVLEAISKIDPTGTDALVGLEPPAVYPLKHDYPDLLPGNLFERAGLGQRTWLLDEFLVRSKQFDGLRIAINERIDKAGERPKLKFQPHCHQRAEAPAADGKPAGANATIQVLRACGFEVEVIDAGCCGMAGTFGYEAEHYELSMQVGKLRFFPAIEQMTAAEQRTSLVATGSACRLQIEQGTEVRAEHSVSWMMRYLREVKG